jgi:hypothetical protein
MLAKCTNSSCDAVFRYLHDGSVFVLENPAVGPATSKKLEYFWLCKRCSSKMTLRLGKDSTVVAKLLLHEIQADGVPLHSQDRGAGFILRNVTLRIPTPPDAKSRIPPPKSSMGRSYGEA